MPRTIRMHIAFDSVLFMLTLAALAVSLLSGWRFYSSLMPTIFSAFGVFATGLVLLRDIMRARSGITQPDVAPSDLTASELEDWVDDHPPIAETARAAARLFGWMIGIYVAIYVVGLLAAMAFGTASFMRLVGKAKWSVTLVTSVAVVALAYLIYDRLIMIVWPRPWLAAFVPGLF